VLLVSEASNSRAQNVVIPLNGVNCFGGSPFCGLAKSLRALTSKHFKINLKFKVLLIGVRQGLSYRVVLANNNKIGYI